MRARRPSRAVLTTDPGRCSPPPPSPPSRVAGKQWRGAEERKRDEERSSRFFGSRPLPHPHHPRFLSRGALNDHFCLQALSPSRTHTYLCIILFRCRRCKRDTLQKKISRASEGRRRRRSAGATDLRFAPHIQQRALFLQAPPLSTNVVSQNVDANTHNSSTRARLCLPLAQKPTRKERNSISIFRRSSAKNSKRPLQSRAPRPPANPGRV